LQRGGVDIPWRPPLVRRGSMMASANRLLAT
jgi:hypothetical protein